jgi:3',5'-cyclic AMP phosphodiesterase CpdA
MYMLRAAAAAIAFGLALDVIAGNTLVPEDDARYAAGSAPDRIVVLPNTDPSSGFTVAWRTDARVRSPRMQIAVAAGSPDLADRARTITAVTQSLEGKNGIAHHHRARVDGLQPDTLYAYRVEGQGTWSEWLQLRTAAREARPFSFLYFGDAQNSIKSLYSRVIREAWRREPQAALAIHAGDLISGGDERDDDEWGEWFEAGSFLHATALTVVAAGNHDHDDVKTQDGERDVLKPSFSAHFPVPENGAPELRASTYTVDYQGVRFIVLDSTSAVSNGTAELQASWIEAKLRDNPNRWTVVVQHHPVFSASVGRDNQALRTHWQPLFERYGVDLVLQGHDHVYGRESYVDAGKEDLGSRGPVYVVSVAGPKQYRLSAQAEQRSRRTAENTQLYQIVRVAADRLSYESRTATGELYDAFEIEKRTDGTKRIIEPKVVLLPEQRCPHAKTRSGRADRCWDGTEW